MFKDLTKISSFTLSLIGFLLIIYGWTDRTMLSLGQTLMVMGAIFFVGGFVIYQLNKIALRSSFALNVLRDIDASLSVPPQTQMNEQLSFIPPKTTAFHMDNDAEFKQALEKDAAKILPIVVPAVVALPELRIEEKPPVVENAAAKRDYYNDLATFLEPKAHLMPVSPVPVMEAPVSALPVELPPAPIVAPQEPAVTPYSQKLSDLANDFPELDALLKRDVKLEPEVEEIEEVEEVAPLPAVIREGQISGIPFKLYSDGTIEAQFSNGSHRFASIAEFKNYVEGA